MSIRYRTDAEGPPLPDWNSRYEALSPLDRVPLEMKLSKLYPSAFANRNSGSWRTIWRCLVCVCAADPEQTRDVLGT